MFIKFADFTDRGELSVFVGQLHKNALINIETLVCHSKIDDSSWENYRVWYYNIKMPLERKYVK